MGNHRHHVQPGWDVTLGGERPGGRAERISYRTHLAGSGGGHARPPEEGCLASAREVPSPRGEGAPKRRCALPFILRA